MGAASAETRLFATSCASRAESEIAWRSSGVTPVANANSPDPTTWAWDFAASKTSPASVVASWAINARGVPDRSIDAMYSVACVS